MNTEKDKILDNAINKSINISKNRKKITKNINKNYGRTKAKTKENRKKEVKKQNLKKEEVKKENKKQTRRTSNTRQNTKQKNNEEKNKKNTKATRTTKTIKAKNATRTTKTNTTNKENLKIIPLGGLDEIGKNITLFEYDDEILIVDCGIGFPEEDMLGIDIVIPDFTYLEKNHNKIKGLVITHGHEDHIGAVPYLLKKINIPVYAPRYAAGLIENKLQEHRIKNAKLTEIHAGEKIKIGKHFNIDLIHSSHSIRDSLMLAIRTPVGIVVHTGDFKVEFSPVHGKAMDIGKMAEIGNEGVLALLSDSTNSEVPGFTVSEKLVGKVFADIFEGEERRIVIATFSSHVDRVQQIINAAVENNRKVSISGRSMDNMVKTAKKLGYLDVPDETFVSLDSIDKYADEEVVIITTGSQGETMSALSRMATGQHKKVKIGENDLVVISATPIPGNELNVSNIINLLMKSGAEVIYSSDENLHVSGHACQEEQKLILSLFRPKFFLPVHGEYRQLMAHAHTAKLLGMSEENIALMENGLTMELTEDSMKKGQSVPHGKIFVDGFGVGDVGNVVLRDRQHLSQDGLITIVITIDSKTGELIAGPDIVSRGFVYIKESEELLERLKERILKTIEETDSKDWTVLKGSVRAAVLRFVYRRTGRNPMVLPIIVEV